MSEIPGAQLTIDGGEVELGALERRLDGSAMLTGAQREILAFVAQEGAITSTDAGLIVHRRRPLPRLKPSGWERGRRCRSLARPYPPNAKGCCRACAVDGNLALKRLEARGYLRRTTTGLWEPISAPSS